MRASSRSSRTPTGCRWGSAGGVAPCRFHHSLLHEGGFAITQPGPHRFLFHRPDGSVIPAAGPATDGDVERLAGDNRTAGATPTADSLLPDWDGTRQDIDAAVAALAWADHGAADGGMGAADVVTEAQAS
jgi:hypothetical protein